MMAGSRVRAFHILQVRNDEYLKDSGTHTGPPMTTVIGVKRNHGPKKPLHMNPDRVMPILMASDLRLLSLMGSSTPSSNMSLHVISMSASNRF